MYERFMQLLQEKGITPYRVSKETGVTQTTLSDWKTGRATPKTATLQKIADYFNVSLDWLTGNSEYRNLEDFNNAISYTEESEEGKTEDKAFFRLKKGLEPYNLSESDADFLLSVFKAHKESNK